MPHKPAQKEAQPLTSSPASRKSPSFSPNQVSILSCLTDEFNVHQYPITTDCEIYHLINILNTGRQECSEEGEKTFVANKAALILAKSTKEASKLMAHHGSGLVLRKAFVLK